MKNANKMLKTVCAILCTGAAAMLFAADADLIAKGQAKMQQDQRLGIKISYGGLFGTDKNQVVLSAKNPAVREYEVPYGVTEIKKDSFKDCSTLTVLILSDTVKKIGNDAFKDCSRLKKIVFGKGLIHIGTDAFHGCESLEEITLPASVRVIGKAAFEECDSLKKVTLNKGLREIGEDAFADCKSLKEITIPNTVTKIGKDAFEDTPCNVIFEK